MARQARVKDKFGVYHISQEGSGHRNLFENDNDRNEFLSIVSNSKEKNDFKLYGYCLVKPNSYQLIINSDGADISRIMQEINIKFALYLDSSLPIFNDRYKSNLIRSKDKLMSILEEMHINGRKAAGDYNSYCFYDENELRTTFLLDQEDLDSLPDDCRSIERRDKSHIGNLSQAEAQLNRIAKLENTSLEELLRDRPRRNNLIKEFRKNSTLTLRELGQVFGNLSESTISKILNN